MDIIAENLNGDARTILVEKGGKSQSYLFSFMTRKVIKHPTLFTISEGGMVFRRYLVLGGDRETQKLGRE